MNSNIHDVIGIDTREITLFPRTVVEEILQNVMILLTTIAGTVPLDRDLGVPATIIDDPLPQGLMQLSIFAVEAIQEYEPRVEVQEIEFVPDLQAAIEGRLVPKVTVRILDEYL